MGISIETNSLEKPKFQCYHTLIHIKLDFIQWILLFQVELWKLWLFFSGEKGTDKISITLQSACCACHVAINNSYFDLMGYLLLIDFKELLQRWIYVLLSEVYRSQDEQRHKITYSRSFSKPGVFKWVVSGILPFWFRLQFTVTLQEQSDTDLNFN